jgi:hypothetical protein
VACTAWGARACTGTSRASIPWSEDAERSTTCRARYLEEGRRSPWDRGGQINARVMTSSRQQERQAGVQQENPRTLRGHTAPCLGHELTDGTQQKIVRRTAVDGGCPVGGSRVAGACGSMGRSKRCRSGGGLYRYFPGVLHRQGKLDKECEQTEPHSSARGYLVPRPQGSWMSCSVLMHPG